MKKEIVPSMVGVLAKNYCACKYSLGTKLEELMDLIDNIKVGDAESKSQDVLERIYECFLGKFADAEGKWKWSVLYPMKYFQASR